MAQIKLPMGTRMAIKQVRKHPRKAIKYAGVGAKMAVKPVRKAVVSQVPKPVRSGVSTATSSIAEVSSQAAETAKDVGRRALAMPVVLVAAGVEATQRAVSQTAVPAAQRAREVGGQVAANPRIVVTESQQAVQRARAASERAIIDAVQNTTTAVIDSGALETVLSTALANGVVDQIANVLLAHPELLETEAATRLSEQLLASPQAQMMIERVADSPEIRRALAQQTAGIADEVAAGMRTRTVSADDRVERVARRLLRRPPIDRRSPAKTPLEPPVSQ